MIVLRWLVLKEDDFKYILSVNDLTSGTLSYVSHIINIILNPFPHTTADDFKRILSKHRQSP